MTDSDRPREFEMTLELDAPVETVWKALTDAAELCNWFPLDARVKPGEGGSIFVSWGAGCEGEAPITIWEPQRRLQWTEHHPAKDGGEPVAIVVDYQLESKGDRTVLRLVHSGFGKGDTWDRYYDSISRGWKFELRGLRHYLQHHLGTRRDVIWARVASSLDRDEIARRVIGREGRILEGDIEGLNEGDAYRLSIRGAESLKHLEGEVRVNGLPDSFAATVTNLNNAYLRFEIENMGGKQETWLWLSTYGVDAARRESIEKEWTAALTTALS